MKPLTPEIICALSARKLESAYAALSAESSALCDEFIAAGRGYELPTETRLLTDPLALRWIANAAQLGAIIAEKNTRKMWHGSLKPIRRESAWTDYGNPRNA